MKKILPIVLLLISACASQPGNIYRKSAADENVKEKEEFSWIDQLNFDKKTEVKYQADKDEFDIASDKTTNSLINESLFYFPIARLDEALSKSDDALVKINIKCYQKKIDEALKVADDVYDQYKNNASYWNQLGTCYYLKSDFAKAILFYNKSRDLDSKFAPPVNNLGVVYNKLEKFQKALAAFKKASEMSAFSSTPVYNLAQLYLRFGTVAKALPIFQGLQTKSPKDLEVNSALASANLIKGDFATALQIYTSLDKDSLTRPAIGLNYAVALKLLNRQSDAIAAFTNVSASSNLEIKMYAERVEKFIRN